jgi:transposase
MSILVRSIPREEQIMEVIHKRCAGIDVHKKSLTVCVRRVGQDGRLEQSVRTFGTMTCQLLELADWLQQLEVTHAAMESTGVLWKPIYNILDGQLELLLVNAQHIKHVPGRKSDVSDSQWLAELLAVGLLRPSFVPERPLRELRDLTRHRAQLSGEKARQINRIHKVLEDANIKLGCVASDIMGASGRAMLKAIIAGQEDARELAELARKRLREKIPALELALQGHLRDHHRFLLKMHFEHVLYLEGLMAQLDGRIEQLMRTPEPAAPAAAPPNPDGPPPPASTPPAPPANTQGPETPIAPLWLGEAETLIDEIPGVDWSGAQDLLAEIGTDMSRFATHKDLASWARRCPGSEESAGKRKSAKTGRGNPWLGRVLGQMAWAASHTKDTYLAAQFKRLARKRGKKRAIVAVGHSILVIAYYMLKYGRHFVELGADFLDRLEPERVKQYHVRRLESMGYKVNLAKEAVAM